MGGKSRRKGATGEREFINLLKDYLGDRTIARNLEQCRQGGSDVAEGEQKILANWAIEIKRAAKPTLSAWWDQAERQAEGKTPALAYRLDRQPWRVRVPLHALNGMAGQGLTWTTEMSVEAFCAVVRETL